MTTSMAPRQSSSYHLSGASYFADLYDSIPPSIEAPPLSESNSSSGFPWGVTASATSSSASPLPIPSRHPKSRITPARAKSGHKPNPRPHPFLYRPTLDFTPRRPASADALSPLSLSGSDDREGHGECNAAVGAQEGPVCAATEYKLKRRAQNRAAQRAFRVRQTARVKELEWELASIGTAYEVLRGEYERCCGVWEWERKMGIAL